jgi:hypothetical protein
MFEELKKYFAHLIVRKKYLKKNASAICYNGFLTNSHNILIIMPKQDKDFFFALDILRYYQIHKKNITLFLPEHKYNAVPEKEKYKYISYSLYQITQLNLPNKNIRKKLKDIEFDAVIDLNRVEDIFFSAVANLVKSKMRVGFKRGLMDNYYNLVIDQKQDDPEIAFRGFLAFIQMF